MAEKSVSVAIYSHIMVAVRQLDLTAFCVALMLCSATASVVKDDNAIVDLAFQGYYKAINMSGSYRLACIYIVVVYI